MSSSARLARLASSSTSTSARSPLTLVSSAARHTRLTAPLPAQQQQQQRRHYAVPVNLSSSVDHLLGVTAPAAPCEGEGDRVITGNARPSNPNDLAEFLKPSSRNARGGGAEQSRSGSSSSAGGGGGMGAMRRAIGAIPTRNLELEGAFSPPDAPVPQPDVSNPASTDRHSIPRASQSTIPQHQPIDRETPHPIDALRGRNDLDERVFAAAKALFYSRREAATTLPTLLEQFDARADVQLPIELPYESRPAQERRVPLTGADSSEEQLALAEDDGVLLVAYVAGLGGPRGAERISICSGFALAGGEELAAASGLEGSNAGALVVSCAHTLRSSLPVPARKGSTFTRHTPQGDASVALCFTRQGHIFPVVQLLSSQPKSDLVLLQLAAEPLRPTVLPTDDAQLAPAPRSTGLRTLPVSPYPAVVGSELCVSSAFGWEDDSGAQLPPFHFVSSSSSASSGGASGESGASVNEASPSLRLATPVAPPEGRDAQTVKRERDDAGRSRWGRARLVEYKDAMGHEAKTGTYDDLSELDFKLINSSANPPALHASPPLPSSSSSSTTTSTSSNAERRRGIANFPPPGSSGGPIVDLETGAVVGVTRGTKMGLLEGRRGDGIPAEKIFEFFTLPGMAKKR